MKKAICHTIAIKASTCIVPLGVQVTSVAEEGIQESLYPFTRNLKNSNWF
jgi:hypothetical protein